MRICRFDEGQVGVVRDGRVFDVTARLPGVGDDDWISIIAAATALPVGVIEACRAYDVGHVRLIAPVPTPGKIVAAPVNYAAHVREMAAAGVSPGHDIPEIRTAGLFLKAPSSLVGPADGISLRFPERRTDYEVELVAVIGRRAAGISAERALDYVAGYCVGLDITLRGPEDRSFRKSIDSYSVVGPWLTTADEIADPQDLALKLWCNGELRQHGSTADMVLGVAQLIAFASSFYTLYPGDLLFTGTPQGVGPIHAGDELQAEGSGLGVMTVAVKPVPWFLTA